MNDNDWWIETENRSAVSNFLIKKVGDCDYCHRVNGLFASVCRVLWNFFPSWFIAQYNESPEFRRSLCPHFEPGSTDLQSELDKIIKENAVFPQMHMNL